MSAGRKTCGCLQCAVHHTAQAWLADNPGQLSPEEAIVSVALVVGQQVGLLASEATGGDFEVRAHRLISEAAAALARGVEAGSKGRIAATGASLVTRPEREGGLH
jgi:hypothetical protein